MTKIPFNITSISRAVSALMLTMASFGMMSDANAKDKIMSANQAPSCSSCHTNNAFTKAEGQTGLKAFCLKKYPKGKGLYSTSSFVCTAPATIPASTPTTATPPAPASQSASTPALTQCGDSDEYDDDDRDHDHDEDRRAEDDEDIDVRPTITAPEKVSVHAGERLSFAVTAFDCADRPLVIKASGLPKGATIVNSVDPELQMTKAVITWAPSADIEDRRYKIVLRAVATDSESKKSVVSSPKKLVITVLPAVQVPVDYQDSLVKSNTVSSARFNAKSKKLEVSGQVAWNKASSAAQRKAILAKEKTAVITNAENGTILGKAVVSNNGKWRAVISTGKTPVPCAIDVTFHGKTGVKAVKGVKNCQH